MAHGDLSAKTGSDKPATNGKSFNMQASPSTPSLDGRGDVIALYRGCPGLLYFDWLWRPWAYFDHPAHWISWYAAYGFFIGAIFFMIGSFAAVVPDVFNTAVTGDCMGDPYDWWVNFTYMAGIIAWQPAVAFQMIEAQNTGYDARVIDWEASGRQGPKPRYIWFAFPWRRLDWWGAFCYTVGVMLYILAIASTIVNDCPNTTMTSMQYYGLIDIAYIIGGFLFGFAGLFYVMSDISIYVYPGIFVPLNWRDAKSMRWWGMWWYFWGGWCFAAGGMQLYWDSPINAVTSVATYNIIEAVTFGGGTTCFFIGAILFLCRMSRGRCKPSYAEVGRTDPTIHTGPHVGGFAQGKPTADNSV